MLNITLTPQKCCNYDVNKVKKSGSNELMLKSAIVQDAFVKSAKKQVSFKGSKEKDFFRANPVIKDTIEKVVSGYSSAVDKLNDLVVDKALEQGEVKLINTHLSKELLESAYHFPSEEKVISLIKLGGVGAVVVDRCNAYGKMVRSDFSIIRTGKRSAERNFNQAGKVLKVISRMKDPELKLYARNQAKKALVGILNEDSSQFARLEALDIMKKFNLFNTKSDVGFVVSEIDNLENESGAVRYAVEMLPEAINELIETNKKLDQQDLKTVILESLSSLSQLKRDRATSRKTRSICATATTKILTNHKIPQPLRSQMIETYYKS